MAQEPIRTDKICQNCSEEVNERFCPNCGQENIETRKSFHHIFSHFLADLTHYDNSFWKTIYNLLFKPAALSKAYISGKRTYYLNPFRLYLFISFITFLAISLFSADNIDTKAETSSNKEVKFEPTNIPTIDSLHIQEKGIDGLTKIGIISQDNNDTLKKILKDTIKIDTKGLINIGLVNKKELDSLQKEGSDHVEAKSIKYWFLKKWLATEENHTNEEVIADFSKSFLSNFPKVLFMYLPIFAFILWWFHDKKKWYYFDHGIFTLHYFSFLLLMNFVLFGLNKLAPLTSSSNVLGWIHFSLKSLGYGYMFYYFFPAHRLFYGDKFFLSFFKSALVFIINFLLISTFLVVFSLYTYINLK
jgi:hypothetical protein